MYGIPEFMYVYKSHNEKLSEITSGWNFNVDSMFVMQSMINNLKF